MTTAHRILPAGLRARARAALNSLGYDFHVKAAVDTSFPPDIDAREREEIAKVLPFTMTGGGSSRR
jgi:hypothetical protein